MVIKIPAGTNIYLTKKRPYPLYIQPDKTLVNDNLYVAYDLRINGQTVIPKGTRVMGDWVTESRPTIGAQLQLHRIYLHGAGQEIKADSDVIEATTLYDRSDVKNANFLYKQLHFRGPSNLNRRVANMNCMIKTLLDNNLNTIYLEILTREIPVTLIEDLIVSSCRCK